MRWGFSGDFWRKVTRNCSNNDNNKNRNKIITVIIVVYFERRAGERC